MCWSLAMSTASMAVDLFESPVGRREARLRSKSTAAKSAVSGSDWCVVAWVAVALSVTTPSLMNSRNVPTVVGP